MIQLAWLIPVFPALGALINGLFGRSHIKDRAHLIAIGAVAASFLISCLVFISMATGAPSTTITLYEWIASDNFKVNIAFLIDPLTSIMLMVVTGVGLLVHIYSSGYMHHDEGYWRFFTYLNLFMFSMLILILGDNYLLMFVGWEGVGLCSYLLIGFWYHKPSATTAGNKAFIVNRIGDAGFLLGIFTLFMTYGSVRYLDIFPNAGLATGSVATAITLFLFIGAMGKSAQVPLYVWLPDAMEGPTPVSALIHAATMVTAGIYMVVRSNALFALAPFSLEVVAVVGAITAIFAASIGLVQTDIKRVLAYSTVSQLGYMFLACGVGAYVSGVFHLFTHAFFKGLLFLGSGSVIHALSGEQDMRKMGALYNKIPITYKTFLIGTIAIAGIPPLAGFWSKDEILASAFAGGHYLLWGVGIITAFMTSFYMFRLLFLTFHGQSRVDHEVEHHIHESPSSMTVPLMILAGFSLLVGVLVGFPPESGWIHHFLSPILAKGGHEEGHHLSLGLELGLMALSTLVAVSGWALARHFYIKEPQLPKMIAERAHGVYTTLVNKYWVDEIYQAVIVRPLLWFSNFLWTFDQWVLDGLVNASGWLTLLESRISEMFDIYIVDGTVNGVSTTLDVGARGLRRLQTGAVQNYVLAMVMGIVVLAVVFMF
ncbi:MAG: NADH-quinone oxidoreductase subunit L [Candidatus Manganitrophus sp.]|nr:NADH-quinone oxidoreductase subunit L [Candidatus Manganitrophus sp.]